MSDLVDHLGLIARTGVGDVSASEYKTACANAAGEIVRLREALDLFTRSAYPVSEEINPRGHNWCEAYLDQALVNVRRRP